MKSFKEQLQEDLKNVFFNPNEFGTLATINKTNRSIAGMFSTEHEVGTFDDQQIISNDPIFSCSTSDTYDIKQNEEITINNNCYEVISIENDFFGSTKMILTKVGEE
jgi:hypothetical protein